MLENEVLDLITHTSAGVGGWLGAFAHCQLKKRYLLEYLFHFWGQLVIEGALLPRHSFGLTLCSTGQCGCRCMSSYSIIAVKRGWLVQTVSVTKSALCISFSC